MLAITSVPITGLPRVYGFTATRDAMLGYLRDLLDPLHQTPLEELLHRLADALGEASGFQLLVDPPTGQDIQQSSCQYGRPPPFDPPRLDGTIRVHLYPATMGSKCDPWDPRLG